MAVTVSFLGGTGQVQSMDLPSGIDLSAYFRSQQPIPLSALGQQATSFFGSPSGHTFLETPAGGAFLNQAAKFASEFGVGGSEQTFTTPNVLGAVGQQAPSFLGHLAAVSGIPQAIQGLGNLSSNVAAGGIGGALGGLPAVPATFANPAAGLGVIGLGEAPAGAQAATAGLAGTGGEIGGFLPGLGAAASIGSGIADLVQGKLPTGIGSLAGAGLGAAIGSVVPGIGTVLGAALGGGGGGLLGGLFGGLFGGGHPRVSVNLPGFSHPIRQTLGGRQTSIKSFQEGTGAVGPFEQALAAANTPQELLAAINQQRSPFPGQFRVDAPGGFLSLGGTPFAPQSSPFTLQALQDPTVLRGLTVSAGTLGAPANQPQAADFLRQEIARVFAGGPGRPRSPAPTAPVNVVPALPPMSQIGFGESAPVDPSTLLAFLNQGGS